MKMKFSQVFFMRLVETGVSPEPSVHGLSVNYDILGLIEKRNLYLSPAFF